MFPTTPGAHWTYRYQFSPGKADTTVVCRVTGTRIIENRRYHVFTHYPGPIMPGVFHRQPARLLRYDAMQQAIVEWMERIQRDVVLFRVADPLVSRRPEYTVSAGPFADVLMQEADSQLRDAGTTQVYAPNAGLIKFSFMTIAGGGSFELIEYRISPR